MIVAFRRHPTWVAALAATGLLLTAACTLTSPATRAESKPMDAMPRAAATASPTGPSGASAVPGNHGSDALVVTGNTATITAQTLTVSGNVVLTTDTANVADRAALAKLDTPLKDVALDAIPLDAVIDFFHDRTGANFVVRWKVLENAGIDRKTPVSIKLGDVPARVALAHALADAGGNAHLSYEVVDGIVTVSTLDDLLLNAKTTTQVYNVRDLLEQMTPNVTYAPGGPEGGGVTATESPYSPQHTAALITVIKQNVSPGLWKDNGGSIASVSDFDGLLTINATSTIHAQVADLLARLREAAKESAKPQATSLKPATPPAHKAEAPAGDTVRQVYDVHDFIDVPPTQTTPLTPDQRAALKDLEASVTSFLSLHASTGMVTSVNGMLIVSTTKEGQAQVERLLDDLLTRHAERVKWAASKRQQEADAKSK